MRTLRHASEPLKADASVIAKAFVKASAKENAMEILLQQEMMLVLRMVEKSGKLRGYEWAQTREYKMAFEWESEWAAVKELGKASVYHKLGCCRMQLQA